MIGLILCSLIFRVPSSMFIIVVIVLHHSRLIWGIWCCQCLFSLLFACTCLMTRCLSF